MRKKKPSIKKLLASIGIDAIGYLSYALPGVGESFDLFWAPVSAALVYSMYENTYFSTGNFIEEVLPGSDFIPTATINWFYETIKR